MKVISGASKSANSKILDSSECCISGGQIGRQFNLHRSPNVTPTDLDQPVQNNHSSLQQCSLCFYICIKGWLLLKLKFTFAYHSSILTLSKAFLRINNWEMKSESGFSVANTSWLIKILFQQYLLKILPLRVTSRPKHPIVYQMNQELNKAAILWQSES